jgi:hypothetical protein
MIPIIFAHLVMAIFLGLSLFLLSGVRFFFIKENDNRTPSEPSNIDMGMVSLFLSAIFGTIGLLTVNAFYPALNLF